jgi:hypothetical protein
MEEQSMKIRYISLLFVLIFCIILLPRGLYGQENEMRKAALASLEEWKKTFSDDQTQRLGFDNKADFKASELGTPFKIYTVSPDAMMTYEEGSEFARIVTETNNYAYPVISAGMNKALLWVVRRENKWQVARIGSAKLARTIRSTEGVIENRKSQMGLEGAKTPKFVRIYQLYLDFFFIKTTEKEYIIPMFTIPDLRIEGSKFYSPAEIVPQWKEQLKKKIPSKETGEEIIEG